MPTTVKPILKSNDSFLWILYCNYCTNQRDLPTKTVPMSVRNHKKLLDFERIWVLLRDFGVCPDLCRKTELHELLAQVFAEDPNNSKNNNRSNTDTQSSPVTKAPVTSDSKVKSPNTGISKVNTPNPSDSKMKSPKPTTAPSSSLSFDNFLKLLWKIASICLEIPLASPRRRIIFLLTKMDRYRHHNYHYHNYYIIILCYYFSSNGRARMLQLFRSAKNIPAFNLEKQTAISTLKSP